MKADSVHLTTTAQQPAKQPFKQLLNEAKAAQAGGARPGPGAVMAKQPGKATVTPLRSEEPTVKGLALAAAPKGLAVKANALAASPTVAAVAAQAAGATRKMARATVEGEAERLDGVRGQHLQTQAQLTARGAEFSMRSEEKIDARVLGLIVKELETSFDQEPPRVGRAANTDGQPQGMQAAGPDKTPQAEKPARAEQAMALIERIETFVRSNRPALALTLNNSLGARVEIERMGPGQIALKLIGQKGPPSADAVSRVREELRARGLRIGALSVA